MSTYNKDIIIIIIIIITCKEQLCIAEWLAK